MNRGATRQGPGRSGPVHPLSCGLHHPGKVAARRAGTSGGTGRASATPFRAGQPKRQTVLLGEVPRAKDEGRREAGERLSSVSVRPFSFVLRTYEEGVGWVVYRLG